MTTSDAAAAPPAPALNPWLGMWIRPRATIRRILDAGSTRHVFLLVSIGGIAQLLSRASTKSVGDHISFPSVLAYCILVGPLSGIIGMYVYAALLRWTGSIVGGKATTSAPLRIALAWPNAVIAWQLALWVPCLLLLGEEMFTTETPRLDESILLLLAFVGLGLVQLVIGIWWIVVCLKSIGEAQGFSAWRALANAILAFLALCVIVLPILACVFIAMRVSR